MKLRTALAFIILTALQSSGGELPRRVTLGVGAVPAAPDALEVFGAGHGLVVQKVTPGFPAGDAGIREGDLLLSLGGSELYQPMALVEAVRRSGAGDTLSFEIVRKEGKELARRSIPVTLREHPRESSDLHDVIYGHAEADGNRYRTIATKPKGTGPHPALFIVQGLGCFTVDDPGTRFSYREIVDAASEKGYATLRVDKPGIGDSEGGPCQTVDFHTEVRAYQAGLEWLVSLPWVDGDRVALFGHSMGGIMAPLIAEAAPIERAITYGAGFNSWYFYMLENTRRQMRLGGVPFETIAAREKSFEKLNALLFIEGRTLAEALEAVPEWKSEFPDGRSYAAGKPVEYFQQIYGLNLAKEWKESGMKVLAIWGTSDFVATETEQEWLAAAVDSWIPGGGVYLPVEDTDHWMNRATSFQQSMIQGPMNGELNMEVIDSIVGFLVD